MRGQDARVRIPASGGCVRLVPTCTTACTLLGLSGCRFEHPGARVVLLFLIGAAPRIEHHGLQRFTIAHARWLLRAGNGRVVPRQERLQSLGLSITHPDNLTEQLGISGPPIVKIGRPSAGPPQAPSSPLAPTCPATSVSPQLPFPFPLPPSPPPYHSPHL